MDYSKEERRNLAKKSVQWKCDRCKLENSKAFPELKEAPRQETTLESVNSSPSQQNSSIPQPQQPPLLLNDSSQNQQPGSGGGPSNNDLNPPHLIKLPTPPPPVNLPNPNPLPLSTPPTPSPPPPPLDQSNPHQQFKDPTAMMIDQAIAVLVFAILVLLCKKFLF